MVVPEAVAANGSLRDLACYDSSIAFHAGETTDRSDCFALPLRLRAFRLARPEKKSLFKLWSSRIDYSSMRREASITLRIPIAKNATRIPGGVLQKSELRQRPFRRRMRRDIKMYQPAAITLDHDKDKKNLEEGSRYCEEIDGSQLSRVIV